MQRVVSFCFIHTNASIDIDRRHGNLSSTIRLLVLDHYRSMANQNLS
jgi:hypothetical protein